MRKLLSPEDQEIFERYGMELETVTAELKRLKGRESKIKTAIRNLFDAVRLPLSEGASEYLHMPDGNSLRVTTPRDSAPKVDAEKFREALGEELFLRVGTITSYELDMNKWQEALNEELVLESDLIASLIESKAATPRVSVVKGHHTVEDLSDE